MKYLKELYKERKEIKQMINKIGEKMNRHHKVQMADWI